MLCLREFGGMTPDALRMLGLDEHARKMEALPRLATMTPDQAVATAMKLSAPLVHSVADAMDNFSWASDFLDDTMGPEILNMKDDARERGLVCALFLMRTKHADAFDSWDRLLPSPMHIKMRHCIDTHTHVASKLADRPITPRNAEKLCKVLMDE